MGAADAKNFKQAAGDWSSQGNAPQAFQSAASTVEGEYRCDYAYHAQMEPLNAVASVSPNGDAVEIWAGTQSQTTAAVLAIVSVGDNHLLIHDSGGDL